MVVKFLCYGSEFPRQKAKSKFLLLALFLIYLSFFSCSHHLSDQPLQLLLWRSIQRQEFSKVLFLPMDETHRVATWPGQASREMKYGCLRICKIGLCGNSL